MKSTRLTAYAALSLCLLTSAACHSPGKVPVQPWQFLFDGRELGAWRESNFGTEESVSIVDGELRLAFGSPLSGVTWSGDFPRNRYELALVAKRVAGTDFFCGVTFPVGEQYCSLILGGWGGAVCGLSCLDGRDASENETTRLRYFATGQEYDVRLRVANGHVSVWLDHERMIHQSLAGRIISLRPEVEPSKPLGIAAYATQAAFREIRYRRLEATAAPEG